MRFSIEVAKAFSPESLINFPSFNFDDNSAEKPRNRKCIATLKWQKTPISFIFLFLFITVGTSDPFVRLLFDGVQHETKVDFRTLNPKWDNETDYVFLVKNPQSTVRFEAYDYDAVGSNDFMGCAELTLGVKGVARSDTVWLDLKPREGDEEDLALSRKYGGLGQLRVTYSYTFYELSRYLASPFLLAQLDGTADGSKLVKAFHQNVAFAEIHDNFAKFAHHLHNFLLPLMWVKMHVCGYKHILEKGEGGGESTEDLQLTVCLVDEHRREIYALVTCMLLLPFLPFGIAERFGRAVVPLLLLFVFRFFSKIAEEGEPEGMPQHPFRFLETEAFREVACGVNEKYIEERSHVDDNALNMATNFVTSSTKQMTGLISGVAKGMVKGVANTVMSPLGGDKPHLFEETKKEMDEDMKVAIQESSPYIVMVTKVLEDIHSIFGWEQQFRTENILRKSFLFFFLAVVNPFPARFVLWVFFSFLFFIPRLQYTDPEKYKRVYYFFEVDYLNVVLSRFGLVDRIEPPTPPPHDAIVPGCYVMVTYEQELPNNTWASKEQIARVVALDGESVIVNWEEEGSDPFTIETRFVRWTQSPTRAVLKPRTAATTATTTAPTTTAPTTSTTTKHKEGECVLVRYEEEEEDGTWIETRDVGKIAKIEGSTVTINWGEDDSVYKCDLSFIEPLTPGSGEGVSTQAPRPRVGTPEELRDSTAIPKVGDIVLVSYECEVEDDVWERTSSPAEVVRHHLSGLIEVRWLDGDGETYSSPAEDIQSLGFKIGETVSIHYECDFDTAEQGEGGQEAEQTDSSKDATWAAASDHAVIMSVTEDAECVVKWVGSDCEEDPHFTTPFSTLSKVE